MTCRELNDSLLQYTSGELAPETRRDLERHLAGCPPCVAYVRSYREMLRQVQPGADLLDQLTAGEAVDELADAILDATLGRARAPRSRRS